MDCDSLKRIHLVCAQIESTNNEFVLYTIHDIDGTLLFTDTLPDHSYYDPFIHVDGNRVHIKYEADNPWRTMYIQYDLEGDITVGPVFLFLDFCIINQNGDFIEEPYIAYDYSDEDIQQIQYLRGSVNDEGDCFLTWSEGETLVWGYYIVLGILDFDWDGLTSSGEPVAFGTYFAVFDNGVEYSVLKVVRLE